LSFLCVGHFLVPAPFYFLAGYPAFPFLSLRERFCPVFFCPSPLVEKSFYPVLAYLFVPNFRSYPSPLFVGPFGPYPISEFFPSIRLDAVGRSLTSNFLLPLSATVPHEPFPLTEKPPMDRGFWRCLRFCFLLLKGNLARGSVHRALDHLFGSFFSASPPRGPFNPLPTRCFPGFEVSIFEPLTIATPLFLYGESPSGVAPTFLQTPAVPPSWVPPFFLAFATRFAFTHSIRPPNPNPMFPPFPLSLDSSP